MVIFGWTGPPFICRTFSALEIAMHVLVADDDRDIRDLVAFKLRHAGIEVTAVADGTQDLDALRRDCPDVALLDVMMPGLSGLDVVREARKEERFATLPMF